ncbi:hypothetical protein [Pelomonas sp. KK5]|uniref:hypothetical protein n=1 Tax=Pelomonas sp. KK5 TaxID=1855730 RepID=UPI00097C0374|nr:hypothetical protein [Pelomonas sp. KK5]
MAIKNDVQKVLTDFDAANEKLKGKAYISGEERTWEDQLDFILERPKNYPNIVKNFLAKFKDLKDKLPSKRKDLDKDQLAWWKTEIMKQAGKSPGFPHIGGMATDVSVKNLDDAGKKLLKEALEKASIKILMEYVSGSDSQYDVALSKANVFHCYK